MVGNRHTHTQIDTTENIPICYAITVWVVFNYTDCIPSLLSASISSRCRNWNQSHNQIFYRNLTKLKLYKLLMAHTCSGIRHDILNYAWLKQIKCTPTHTYRVTHTERCHSCLYMTWWRMFSRSRTELWSTQLTDCECVVLCWSLSIMRSFLARAPVSCSTCSCSYHTHRCLSVWSTQNQVTIYIAIPEAV